MRAQGMMRSECTSMSVSTIGVIGAGVMGSGIAQVAATKGINVILLDANEKAVKTGIDAVESRLSGVVTKGKMTAAEKDAAVRRIKGSKGQNSAAATQRFREDHV